MTDLIMPLNSVRLMSDGVCSHQPRCADARVPDRIAARSLAHHPEQGWSLLCYGVRCLTTVANCFRTAEPSSLPSPIPRPTDREIPGPVTRGRGGVSITDRARQNREYVRTLLKKKQPEFAAVLERVVWELTCSGDAPAAASPAFEQGRIRASATEAG
jgi:hypothetical protein